MRRRSVLDRVVIDHASDEWQAGDITSWKERKTESVCVYKRVFVGKVIGREYEGVGDTSGSLGRESWIRHALRCNPLQASRKPTVVLV